jgi:hypothetical protein
MRAKSALAVPPQKSQRLSSTRPLAHSGQIHAKSVMAVLLQKSHHLSDVRPFAQDGQMRAIATREENFRQNEQV